MPRFVQPFEYRTGEWRVAVRWKREDRFELVEPEAARERADAAERDGDKDLAEALRAAAVKAERESARVSS